MRPVVYSVAPGSSSWTTAITAAARALKAGQLVAFPTETVYGLGANALDSEAVGRIFAAKGRPADNPLIVHISDVPALRPLVSSTPAEVSVLAKHFWPGPLTMVLPRSPLVPDVTTGGLDSVAVRLPAHPVALALLRECGIPVAAPSANLSGRPSPTEAQHVLDDLGAQVSVVLDGGPTGVGVESTVLDLTADEPTILRPGGVTYEQLRQVLATVRVDQRAFVPDIDTAENGPIRSPGMKYRHYAPSTLTTLVEGEPPWLWRRLLTLLQDGQQGRRCFGLLVTDEGENWLRARGLPAEVVIRSLGGREHPEEAAHRLFAALRCLDSAGVDEILIEGVNEEGVGLAVMNRLRRAATQRVHAEAGE